MFILLLLFIYMIFLCYFREELTQECLNKGTELVQAIANELFSLPSHEDRDGPLIKLPNPSTALPREKHVGSILLFFIVVFLPVFSNYAYWLVKFPCL